jgi:hypothetical protein
MTNNVTELREKLDSHPIFNSLQTLGDLRIFMEHHVFAVWDFMSLLKELQRRICPHGSPWMPNKNSNTARLVNEIVLEEESDIASPNLPHQHASHFEIYLNSMKEVGASTAIIENFIQDVSKFGVDKAMETEAVPYPVKQFMRSTFGIINHGSTHQIAASFANGRENLVPLMFLRILDSCKVAKEQAPLFHYYLERHAHLDGEQHGPMADQLLDSLTGGDSLKEKEATEAARKSVEARIDLWNGVLQAIQQAVPIVA